MKQWQVLGSPYFFNLLKAWFVKTPNPFHHMRAHTHTHTHTRACAHAWMHTYTRTHTHTHTHTHTTRTHTHTHTHTHTTRTHADIHTHARTHTHTHAHAHTHTHTHTNTHTHTCAYVHRTHVSIRTFTAKLICSQNMAKRKRQTRETWKSRSPEMSTPVPHGFAALGAAKIGRWWRKRVSYFRKTVGCSAR